MAQVTVVAATGAVGRALVRRLAASGHDVVAVGRDAARLAGLAESRETRVADLTDALALRTALADAERIALCANAVHLPAVLGALPQRLERLVAMGSTRRFSAVPDATASAVRSAESALAKLPVPSVLLLATMIYGTGRGVPERLARLKVAPVPAGVAAQPIHVDDVAKCLEAALFRPQAPGPPIVVAGPEAVSYRDMVRRAAQARGGRTFAVPVPPLLLRALGRCLGGGETGMTLRRLAENKTFDISEMRTRLGVEPRPFAPA